MDTFNFEKINMYYREGYFHTISPSQFVRDHGDLLFDSIQLLVESMYDTPIALLSGYHTSDLKTSVTEGCPFLRKSDRSIPVLIYNTLQMEFAFDLFRFAKKRNPNHFLVIFAKYAKYFSDSPVEEIANWLHRQISEAIACDRIEEINLLKKTIDSMLFVILHERAHSQDDLRNITTRMFFNSKEYTELIDQLSEKERVEVACDYIALYEMVSAQCQVCYDIEASLNTSATDSFAAGILMQHADAIFNLLKYGFGSGGVGNYDLNNLYTSIIKQLKKRSYPLKMALQITENTGNMSLGEINILQAYSYATDLIADFMQCLGEALQILEKSNTDLIKKQIAIPSLEQGMIEDEIWFRISMIN